MSRVRAAIEAARDEGRAALVIYLTFGDPSPEVSIDLVCAAVAAGADVIELGVPFSDPSADGPVIQRAMERALTGGAGLGRALEAAASIRDRCTAPIVLFGYYNPIAIRGVDRFADEAAAAGIDSVLTVDLPADEIGELADPLRRRGLGVVPLVAPTTTEARLAMLEPLAPPFVYAISMTGVTGASLDQATEGLDELVGSIRRHTSAPVCVGFGIKTAEDAARVARSSDGVVVGSAVVRAIEEAGDPDAAIAAVSSLVTELRRGVSK